VICVSHLKDGHWQRPEIASFSGKSLDFAPHVSADGTQLFFASIRPLPDSKRPHFRIWVSRREGERWSEPVALQAPINQEDSDNIDPAITASGDMYFASNRNDAAGHFHIYFARFRAGQYEDPEKMGPAINSDFNEASPAISPDGRLLVFASTAAPEDPERRRPEDLIAAGKPYPRQDLYVSMFQEGHWSPARHLEHGINSSAEEVNPSFSPDGKYLFWGSERSSFQIPTDPLQRRQVEARWRTPLNGRGNIYFISVHALEAKP
jgi:Tol biopolymer transport system component